MNNLNWIKPKYRKIIDQVLIDDESSGGGCGVYLKRPWIFSASNGSCTFFSFDDYDNDINKTFAALNNCIAQEATKIDADIWDKG